MFTVDLGFSAFFCVRVRNPYGTGRTDGQTDGQIDDHKARYAVHTLQDSAADEDK